MVRHTLVCPGFPPLCYCLAGLDTSTLSRYELVAFLLSSFAYCLSRSCSFCFCAGNVNQPEKMVHLCRCSWNQFLLLQLTSGFVLFGFSQKLASGTGGQFESKQKPVEIQTWWLLHSLSSTSFWWPHNFLHFLKFQLIIYYMIHVVYRSPKLSECETLNLRQLSSLRWALRDSYKAQPFHNHMIKAPL